jgi:hypothetical protein
MTALESDLAPVYGPLTDFAAGMNRATLLEVRISTEPDPLLKLRSFLFAEGSTTEAEDFAFLHRDGAFFVHGLVVKGPEVTGHVAGELEGDGAAGCGGGSWGRIAATQREPGRGFCRQWGFGFR